MSTFHTRHYADEMPPMSRSPPEHRLLPVQEFNRTRADEAARPQMTTSVHPPRSDDFLLQDYDYNYATVASNMNAHHNHKSVVTPTSQKQTNSGLYPYGTQQSPLGSHSYQPGATPAPQMPQPMYQRHNLTAPVMHQSYQGASQPPPALPQGSYSQRW